MERMLSDVAEGERLNVARGYFEGYRMVPKVNVGGCGGEVVVMCAITLGSLLLLETRGAVFAKRFLRAKGG